MASNTQQLNYKGKKSSWRNWVRQIKQATNKKMRKLGKFFLEDAPKRKTEGWAD